MANKIKIMGNVVNGVGREINALVWTGVNSCLRSLQGRPAVKLKPAKTNVPCATVRPSTRNRRGTLADVSASYEKKKRNRMN